MEEDEHQWLGVPGIYSPREAHAAELFDVIAGNQADHACFMG